MGQGKMDRQMGQVLLGMGDLVSLTEWAHRVHRMAEEAQAHQTVRGNPGRQMELGTMDHQMALGMQGRQSASGTMVHQLA
jgi:signal recognition particle GTPase